MNQLYTPKREPMRMAAFMSDMGSNLKKILELQENLEREGKRLFKVVMIFTDTADETVCNARKIAEEYKVAYYYTDINEYYRKLGYTDKKDMKIRQQYDSETAKLLKMHKVDVVALCGYMSIITKPVIGNFLTLNVHPADLRIKDGSGRRKYAGCVGPDCVKKAIMNGDKEIRATTHIVSEEVDSGQLLLVSKPVKLDTNITAHEYQQKLKEEGDWKIYPETLRLLAEGRFSADEKGMVYLDEKYIPEGHLAGD